MVKNKDMIKYRDLIKNIFNPYGKFNCNELMYVLEYLDSENIENDSNPWSARLENAFANKMGAEYAIAHNSGTSTLHSCCSMLLVWVLVMR